MVDATGIKYRIGLNEEDIAEDIQEEFEENQRESWAALKFAGMASHTLVGWKPAQWLAVL